MYGTLENGIMKPAPRAIRIGDSVVCNPTPAQYEAAGYKRVVDTPPTTDDDHYAVATGWTRNVDTWERTYEVRANPAPAVSDFDATMEDHLYEERAARGYTTREPDSYLTSSVQRWAQDARDWVAHRDAVMEYALALINAVKAGTREPPTMAEFKEGLPNITWTFAEESN